MDLLQRVNWEFTIGVALGILGFGIGVYHVAGLRVATKLAKEHAEHLVVVTKQLEEVQGGLSTRYIGEFPYFIPEIVSMLERATRKIVICCDYPGYGFFSAPTASLAYEQVVDRKKTSVELTLTCLSSAARLRLQREQFSDPEWAAWRQNAEFAEKLTKFAATHAVGLDIRDITYNELLEVQEQIDADLIKRVFGSGRTTEIDGYFPLHFWVVDDSMAIFAIPTLAGPILEYGFKTSDRTLIEALLLIPSRYRRDANRNVNIHYVAAKDVVASDQATTEKSHTGPMR